MSNEREALEIGTSKTYKILNRASIDILHF
jgi:hypothetical protein